MEELIYNSFHSEFIDDSKRKSFSSKLQLLIVTKSKLPSDSERLNPGTRHRDTGKTPDLSVEHKSNIKFTRPTQFTRALSERFLGSSFSNSAAFKDNEEHFSPAKLGNPISYSPADQLTHPLVEISQHSSFNREQYIRYHSSLSTQGVSSSIAPHQDSGLGQSFSGSERSDSVKFHRDVIVLDSQSSAASASYVPSTSTFTGVNPSSQAGSIFNHSQTAASKLNSRRDHSLLDSIVIPLIEDFSSPFIPETPNQQISSGRSISLPPQSSFAALEHINPRPTRYSQFTRNLSDPNPTVSSNYRQIRSLQGSRPSLGQRIARSSRAEIPESSGHSTSLRPKSKIDTPETDLEFRTQVPLDLASQNTQNSSKYSGKSSLSRLLE